MLISIGSDLLIFPAAYQVSAELMWADEPGERIEEGRGIPSA